MKAFVNKKTKKNLIIIILVITILSALVPRVSQASTDIEDGGGILHPIENFTLFLCDTVMNWLQHTFTSPENIEIEEGVWDFKYSPAIIFSGTVPALDINFIKPSDKKIEANYDKTVTECIRNYFNSAKSKKNTDSTNFENAKKQEGAQLVELKVRLDDSNNIRLGSDYINGGSTAKERTFYAYYWKDEENEKINIECEYHINNPNYNPGGVAANSRFRRTSLLLFGIRR